MEEPEEQRKGVEGKGVEGKGVEKRKREGEGKRKNE